MSVRNTRLLSSFNREVNINLPFASIPGVYMAAKQMENSNKLLPRYFHRYKMNSTNECPSFSYDSDQYVFRIKGPTMKVYKMLLNPNFLRTANELRLATLSMNDESQEPDTLDETTFGKNIVEYEANIDDSREMCPITQENFKEGDIIAKTSCGHKFISTKLKEYLLNYGNSCPMCRQEFN